MYDLHTHSNSSDGILRPQELVSRAKERGVTCLALTDHDTLAGIAEAKAAAAELDLDFITGIEFSTQWNGYGIHIVGLNLDESLASMQSAVSDQSQRRLERTHLIAERLEKVGIKGALEGATGQANGGSIGRPHFAKFMVEKGYVNDIHGAF